MALNYCLLTSTEIKKLDKVLTKKNPFSQKCFKDPFFIWPKWLQDEEEERKMVEKVKKSFKPTCENPNHDHDHHHHH
jgi:hypothetical protein